MLTKFDTLIDLHTQTPYLVGETTKKKNATYIEGDRFSAELVISLPLPWRC